MSDDYMRARDVEGVEEPARAPASREAVAAAFGQVAPEPAGEAVGPAPPPGEAVGPGPPPGEETVDALPVLAEVRPLARSNGSALPAVQAAAVAATGFLAGAATIALVKRRTARRVVRSHRANPARPTDLLPIVGSRTFIVDVHLLAKPE